MNMTLQNVKIFSSFFQRLAHIMMILEESCNYDSVCLYLNCSEHNSVFTYIPNEFTA